MERKPQEGGVKELWERDLSPEVKEAFAEAQKAIREIEKCLKALLVA